MLDHQCAQRAACSRRSFFAGGGAAVTAALLAACGPSRQTDTPATTTQGPVTLRYAAGFGPAEATTYGGGLTRVVEAFNARGGPIRIQPESPSPLYPTVLAQAAAGDPPDLSHTHPREYHPFVNAGALLELDTSMKKDRQNVPDLVPTVLQYLFRDGHHWALPNNWSPQAIYFNKALFDKHGLKSPDQYEREGRWTFDVYLDLARKLTSGTGERKIWGAPWPTNTLDIQLAFIWPFGGDLWDKALQNTLLDTKESLEAIQFQADLTAKYGVSPTPEEVKQLPRSIGGALSSERGGMEILTTDVLGLLTPTTFPKGMAPMPKGRAGRIVRGAPLGVQLLKGARRHDAAWAYANHQASKESARIMLEMRLTVPWHKSLLAAPERSMRLLPWESAAFYAETANRVRATVYPSQFREIANLYGPAFNAVRAGQKTAPLAIAEIKPQINELLRQR